MPVTTEPPFDTPSKPSTPIITYRYDYADDSNDLEPMPITDPESLIGRTFLMDKQEDGQKFRARVVEAINAHDKEVQKNPELLWFK